MKPRGYEKNNTERLVCDREQGLELAPHNT